MYGSRKNLFIFIRIWYIIATYVLTGQPVLQLSQCHHSVLIVSSYSPYPIMDAKANFIVKG